MKKNILYTEGPATVTCGAAGTFKRGVAKPVDTELADRLLKKTSIKFTEVVEKPASKTKEA